MDVLSSLHLDVPVGALLAQIFEHVASFEVLVGMHDRLQLCCAHDALVLGLLDFCFVQVLKDTVTLLARTRPRP